MREYDVTLWYILANMEGQSYHRVKALAEWEALEAAEKFLLTLRPGALILDRDIQERC